MAINMASAVISEISNRSMKRFSGYILRNGLLTFMVPVLPAIIMSAQDIFKDRLAVQTDPDQTLGIPKGKLLKNWQVTWGWESPNPYCYHRDLDGVKYPGQEKDLPL
ncbi:uncharacterized protein ACOB7L_020156 isoform 1-T2 [Callospermophilus lateralis]|uniref:uncharacterized protein LOC143403080 n=1 Tax=Callospermophilus lateralis TaxID=76772 RepID=UPI004038B5C8